MKKIDELVKKYCPNGWKFWNYKKYLIQKMDILHQKQKKNIGKMAQFHGSECKI